MKVKILTLIVLLDLLFKLCNTIQEEILFTEANSRLDYFKNGIQFDKSIN